MSSSFPAAVVLGGVFGAATLLSSGTAEAGRAHFGGGVRFSGHVGIRGGVSVRFARPVVRPIWRPRVWVGGRVWWGGFYYPRPYYYYYSPEYVPSYYGGSYYPVQPQAAVAPGGVAVAAPAPPPMPTLGLGVFAGGTNVNGMKDSSELGVLGRLRLTPGLLLEAEVAKDEFSGDVAVCSGGTTACNAVTGGSRVDRRIGGSLIWEIGAQNSFAPYLLAGGGVQQAKVSGDSFLSSDFNTTQDFGEIGVGLRWALSRSLHLTADIRAGRRKTIDSNQGQGAVPLARTINPPPVGSSNDTEDYTRARLAAVINF
ncbi:MAG TPA: hypothetical protein VF469_31605 [Kofleriaceae bacterium]